MNKILDKLFNWKKNPESIFPIMIPLVGIAILCNFLVAILKWKQANDPWYLIIFFAIIIPGGFVIFKMVRMFQKNLAVINGTNSDIIKKMKEMEKRIRTEEKHQKESLIRNIVHTGLFSKEAMLERFPYDKAIVEQVFEEMK